MEHETDEIPPLLRLDDKCLLDIFKLLELKDCANLADTCIRLRNVARLNKFKNIYVCTTTTSGFEFRNMLSKLVFKDEFVNIMSLIGEHVLNVHISHGLNDVFEIIRENCKNVNILQTYKCQEPIQIHGFDNLKKLKLIPSWPGIDFNVLPDFDNNIVDLDLSKLIMHFDWDDQRKYFLELLDRLPKLKSLELGRVFNFYCIHSRELMPRISKLTSFSFNTVNNYNHLLQKLSNLNLVKLRFQMELNPTSFDILQQFQHLEVLVMLHNREMQQMQFPETAVFPPKLKHVTIDNIDISFNKFSSIVEKAKYLEVVNLGSYGRILFDHDPFKHFPNEKAGGRKNLVLITRIEKHLQRTLTIKYSHETLDQQSCVYNSKNLKVINSWITDKQKPKEKIERIYLKLDSANFRF